MYNIKTLASPLLDEIFKVLAHVFSIFQALCEDVKGNCAGEIWTLKQNSQGRDFHISIIIDRHSIGFRSGTRTSWIPQMHGKSLKMETSLVAKKR